jgi:hypothetical protein
MDKESPEIRTYFWIGGDNLNPEEFTQVIGISPTDSGVKGTPSPHPTLREQGKTTPWTFWKINLNENSYNTDEVIQKLLSRVWHRRDAILEYVRSKPGVEVGVLIAISIYDDRPVYELSRDTIGKLAYLGCDFAIDDIYDHRNESPPEKS